MPTLDQTQSHTAASEEFIRGLVIVVGFVVVESGLLRQFYAEVIECLHIAVRTGCMPHLNRTPLARGQQVQLQAIEKTVFRGDIAPIGFIGRLKRVETRSTDADVVAAGIREGINEKDFFFDSLPGLAETLEEVGDLVGEQVQASVEVAAREHLRDLARLRKQVAGGLEVVGEETGGDQGDGDHFSGQDVAGVECGSLPVEHRVWESPVSAICP